MNRSWTLLTPGCSSLRAVALEAAPTYPARFDSPAAKLERPYVGQLSYGFFEIVPYLSVPQHIDISMPGNLTGPKYVKQ